MGPGPPPSMALQSPEVSQLGRTGLSEAHRCRVALTQGLRTGGEISELGPLFRALVTCIISKMSDFREILLTTAPADCNPQQLT